MSILFSLNFHQVTLYESLISEYKISWATVIKPYGAVARTVPSGPFQSIPAVFERVLVYGI